MNLVDYTSQAEDHSSLLVVIKNLNGKFHTKTFNRFFERISNIDSISINIPPQQQIITNQLNRLVNIHYVHQHSMSKNAWGNFQVHRKALGLVSLGFKINETDSEDLLLKTHEKLHEELSDTLLDTRLFLIGSCSNSPTINISETINDENNSEEINNKIVNNHKNHQTILNIRQPQVIKYSDVDSCFDLEDKIKEFLRSLFWVLEGKRLDRSHERTDNLIILAAPFEKTDNYNFDLDNKLHRKKCLGRFKKHLGDLCLLAGVPGEASLHYQTALDILKQCSDCLWIAACQEGIAISSYLMLKPKSAPTISFPRSSLLNKTNLSSLRNHTTDNLNSFHNMQNFVKQSPKSLHEDILNNYNAAVLNYSKLKEAAFIEVEASLKACRLLSIYQRNLEAADFLQNIIRINLNISEREKIHHFSTLSLLYAGISMKRKASFYSRIATLVSAIVAKEDNNWQLSYRLLLQSFPGFKLSLDCRHLDYTIVNNGWKSIQLRVLHELVYTARHMEDSNVCIRHLLLLLHTMSDYLSVNEKTELFNSLQTYVSKFQPTLQSIALPDGTILPPVPFFKYPVLCGLRITKLLPHNRPINFFTKSDATDPFIYSPFTLLEDMPDSNIYWIIDEKCEIVFDFYNPLTFELEINNLSAVFDRDVVSCSANFTIPSLSKSQSISLTVTPNVTGQITLSGYIMNVMGIKSHCRFREMPMDEYLKFQRKDFSLIVTPRLPLIKLASTIRNSDNFTTLEDGDFVTTSAFFLAYAGQQIEFSLNIVNVGDIAVENLETLLILTPGLEFLNTCMKWDKNLIVSHLPLQPSQCFDIPIKFLWQPEKLMKKEKSTDCDSALIPLLCVHG